MNNNLLNKITNRFIKELVKAQPVEVRPTLAQIEIDWDMRDEVRRRDNMAHTFGF